MKILRTAIALAVIAISSRTLYANPQNPQFLFKQPNASDTPPLAETQIAIPTTPGGRVALIAALSEPRDTYTRQERIATIVADSDGDGIAIFNLQRAIPVRSIWAAADLMTGAITVLTRPGYPRREWQLSQEKIKNLPVDQFDQIEHEHFIVQILWVRPGEGAWTVTTADGGANDDDHKNNGDTIVTMSSCTPVGNSPAPPKKIKKGDVLLLIDPFEMSFAKVVVNK